jgi:hypothetical protein
MSEEGEEGYMYLTLKTSRYYAKSRFLGTSDMGSELPRVPLKLNSEGISVVPTPGRYYRAPD